MINISHRLAAQIKEEAEKAYPHECCGFIFGRLADGEKYAEQTAASKNSAARNEQYHRFTITADDMLRAELSARKMGKDIVGFYHSHPDHPAVPSEYDRAHALPVYSYIIVSAVKGKAADIRSWELDGQSGYAKFQSEVINTSKGEMK